MPKEIIEPTECIEPEAVRPPILPRYSLLKPFTEEESRALSAEIEEEIAFQAREPAVILAIREIAYQREQFNVDLIKKLEKSPSPVNTFIEHSLSKKVLRTKTTSERELLKATLSQKDLKGFVQCDLTFFRALLKRIDSQVPYLVDVLYMELMQRKHFEQEKGTVVDENNKNNELNYIVEMISMLEPFLTEECRSFYSKIREFYDKEGRVDLLKVVFMVQTELGEISDLITTLNRRIDKIKAISKEENNRLLDELSTFLQSENAIMELERIALMKFIATVSDSEGPIDLLASDYWEMMRGNFERVCQLRKRVEGINQFLNNYTYKAPNNTQPTFDLAEAVREFHRRKKAGLQLWQAQLEENKTERTERQKARRLGVKK